MTRYGAYLRDHAGLFDPWQDAPDGVTSDPVEFAVAAFRVATGPVMSPGFVRWHGRVQGHHAGRSEHDGRLLLSVTLAVPSLVRLGWDWRGWERDFHDRYLEPDDRRPVGLARLELRWPVGTDQLPIPRRPRRPACPICATPPAQSPCWSSRSTPPVGWCWPSWRSASDPGRPAAGRRAGPARRR